jgi:hypothetical protein
MWLLLSCRPYPTLAGNNAGAVDPPLALRRDRRCAGALGKREARGAGEYAPGPTGMETGTLAQGYAVSWEQWMGSFRWEYGRVSSSWDDSIQPQTVIQLSCGSATWKME